MADPTVLAAGPVRLTRVLYTDAVVPAEAVGLTVEAAQAVAWCDERWATDEGVRATAAAWVASRGDQHVVMDPFRNADDIFHDPESADVHIAAITAAFAASGIPVEAVTHVLLSHIEGLGMVAVRDGASWRPFFPNAQILIGVTSKADFEDAPPDHWSSDVWRDLLASGRVATYEDGDEIVPGVVIEHTGAHNPGHHAIHFGPGPEVTFVGHLAVSPLHLSTGLCEPQHVDPQRALDLLLGYAADGRLLIGPLWPSPGAGRFLDGVFEPVATA
ncbi:MAG: hypothetical protein JWM05_3476 [Acidimicrobiales bacterium]|nr:hypothetical protein [Acidimicrobiales bacterium]